MKNFFRGTTAILLIVVSMTFATIVHAEVQTYTGKDEYVIGERETLEQAKEHSKIRALRNAREQAGIYIRSRSRSKDLQLVEDEILTIAEGVVKIIGAPNFEQRVLENGKGILILTTINIQIDTDEVNNWLEKFIHRQKSPEQPVKPAENISPPPAADNITLSKQKVDEAIKLCDKLRFKEALPICNEAIALDSNNSGAYEVLGWIYCALERFDEAIFAENKVLELNPNSGVAYERLAMSYIGKQEYYKAMFYCNKAMEVQPDWIWSYSTRGIIHCRKKNYRQAIADFDKVIQKIPSAAGVYSSRGWAYGGLRNLNQAESDFKKAIELEPDNSGHYDGLGWVYNCLGDYDKAISIFNKAIQLDSSNYHVYEKLGRAYRELKQYRKAIFFCDKSIQIHPNDKNYFWAYVTRGECYQELGEEAKAQADFAKAKELGYNG